MIFDFEKPERYAVMGNPVSHSKSPRIHQEFGRQLGIKLEYTAIQVDPGGFVQAVGNFRAEGGKGLNITVPFKLDAFRLADRLSERARLAGAVNTLKFEDDSLFGDNTDGIGLVRDLTKNLGAPLAGKRVLIVGAGGAVHGVLAPMLEEKPAAVVVANRTASRARELIDEFGNTPGLSASGFDALEGTYDIVINGTSASLRGEVPALPARIFAPGALAYDMMYGDAPTPFLRWAATNGAARSADGLGMLVEQAAESFFVWHGKRPDTGPVIAGLRQH